MNEVRAVARRYAREGVPLSTLLADLDAACRLLGRGDPSARLVRAGSESWARAFTDDVATFSCVDPLTGLATASHLRLRLTEIYRWLGTAQSGDGDTDEADAEPLPPPFVAVVVKAPYAQQDTDSGPAAVAAKLRMAVIGERLRAALLASDTVAAVGHHVVVALVHDRMFSTTQARLLEPVVNGGGGDLAVTVRRLPSHLDEALRWVSSPQEIDRA